MVILLIPILHGQVFESTQVSKKFLLLLSEWKNEKKNYYVSTRWKNGKGTIYGSEPNQFFAPLFLVLFM
jgi:hypothetical protein